VATYDHVLQVLHDPVSFSSETGADRPFGGTILQDLPVAGVMLNMMDDPTHARIRRLLAKGFTRPPCAISRSCDAGPGSSFFPLSTDATSWSM
jgi:cytochrome P450